MKIIKKKPEQPEQINELFGRKKKPAPVPEKVGINHEWDKYYEMLEDIRASGVSVWLAAGYLSEGVKISTEELSKIWYSWIDNYDELAKYFHWDGSIDY